MSQNLLNGKELAAKIREYEQFANDVLKVDLQKATELRARYQLEVEELEELTRNIQQLQKEEQQPLKSRIELGSGVYCRAVVPDTSKIFIAIGLGFHLEVTLKEAVRIIDDRQATLRGHINTCVDKTARIKANLRFVIEAIRELTQLPA